MNRVRVLVVDDSAFARTVLSRLLRSSSEIEVVGTARNGTEALAMIDSLAPDVVSLDLNMPELDGVGVLRQLHGRARPRVIVVSTSGSDTELGAEALALGAVDLVEKPTALASDRLLEIGGPLVAKVVAAGGVPAPIAPELEPSPPSAQRAELVVVGTSTGGPQALTRLVAALPATLAAPVAIALHIPAGYTEGLARRLDALSPLHVVEASDGLVVAPGMIVLARGGSHLRIVRRAGRFVAEVSPVPFRLFTPSVDELFTSAAQVTGARTLGVILTGMGDDGLLGSKLIAAAHGQLVTESARTCVVYGMPRAVEEARLGASSVPLDQIAGAISQRV
ncbi:MAG TPA: chemotaxis-specific protein-glutamate methyltransferase CheB [Kofleriaceae bacterium]|jgi:two-component system chemotaxis response regulator CheB